MASIEQIKAQDHQSLRDLYVAIDAGTDYIMVTKWNEWRAIPPASNGSRCGPTRICI